MKRKLIIATFLMALCAPRLGANVDWPEWGVAVLEVGSSADARQEQQALRNSLEVVGIPYLATADVKEAVRRSLVLIGGILLNTEMTGPQREILYSYVERGGVILATQVQGNMFFPLFGLLNATTSRSNFRVHFTGLEDPLLRYLNRPEERSISLGDPQLYTETIWSTEYSPGPWTKVLARYGNRTGALTVHPYGRGLAYALGLGFKETTLLPQLARSFGAARKWINSFEPSGDVFRLILRGIYEDTVHPFLLVHTVPEGKKTALVLSHDVDALPSFRNSRAFARMEASYGVSSTFFITTKYFRDASDVGYYSPRNVRWIQQLKEMGFAVESHSVSHSLTFDEFPVGSPDVNKESYQPANPTLFGEVRVSKQLLDDDLHQETRGFRAGYLRYPSELLRVLEDSGYLFDSSVSAQYVLTNFPYFGFRRRTPGAEQSNIVVVPVTLDDSRDFLTQETQEHALRTWLDVIHANSENGASTCLLIHPTDTTYKLETERRLIEALRGSNTWIGDVGSLARFWRGRARLRPAVKKGSDGGTLVVLNLRREELPSRLAIVVESTSAGPSPQVVDAEGRPISVSAHESGDRVLMRLP